MACIRVGVHFGRWITLGLALALVAACGGASTISDDGTDGSGGTAASAGGGAGGNGASSGSGKGGNSAGAGASGGDTGVGGGNGGNSAGVGALGGDTGAGGSNGGSSSGVAGISAGDGGSLSGSGGSASGGCGGDCVPGGAGGALPVDCSAEPDFTRGGCVFEFYAHLGTNECTPAGSFVCITGANRFTSLAECLSTCADTKPAMTACDVPNDCVLASSGCCGLCPDAPFESAIGINRERALAGEYQPCGEVQCEPCAEVPVPLRTTGYFVPTCAIGECGVLDLRTDPATECTEDTDCSLRLGSECCEACAGDNLIALSSTDFLAGRCEDVGCPECEPTYPPDYAARCVSGRCTVQFASVAE